MSVDMCGQLFCLGEFDFHLNWLVMVEQRRVAVKMVSDALMKRKTIKLTEAISARVHLHVCCQNRILGHAEHPQ